MADWSKLIYGDGRVRRFTQDSPLLPDVWFSYLRLGEEKGADHPTLLLTPHWPVRPGQLSRALQEIAAGLPVVSEDLEERAGSEVRSSSPVFTYNQSTVRTRLSFSQVVAWLLPISRWWREHVIDRFDGLESVVVKKRKELLSALEDPFSNPCRFRLGRGRTSEVEIDRELLWMVRAVGFTKVAAEGGEGPKSLSLDAEALDGVLDGALIEMRRALQNEPREDGPLLYSVAMNRRASISTHYSVRTLKADAARRLFSLNCDGLGWAVLDSGIDAQHPAFETAESPEAPVVVAAATASKSGKKKQRAKRTSKKKRSRRRTRTAFESRVKQTFDFTRLLDILSLAASPDDEDRGKLQEPPYSLTEDDVESLHRDYLHGRDLDWDTVSRHIRMDHVEGTYVPPEHPHGTHVAGILGAGEVEGRSPGVCPDIHLYDLRVLGSEGEGEEFAIIAALQFIRYLNGHKDSPVIHGANLSLSIAHRVRNYACGRTPVCEESERLVSSGVVTVAAAGNLGLEQVDGPSAVDEGAYRSMTITDPGNADGVITVGATHRELPHAYGISFFSSRGPTGDGRMKPDVVAPGEKIEAPVPNREYETMDGTSMAAPHVSGAAALLMARHRELVGNPLRVKTILCETATDLGRERYFQGYGLVDILRAIQSL